MPPEELIPLPPEDVDADLARRIGNREPLSEENPFERALAALAADAESAHLPDGLSERLWAKVDPQRRPLPSRLSLVPSWARWTSAAAAAILVAAGSWFAFNRGPLVLSSTGDAVVVVSLEDASVVTLRPHTTLYQTGPDAYLLNGEAFFDIAHDPERLVRIRSDLGEVRVLGTRFDVSTWGDETSVFLERGKVVFTHLVTGSVDTLSPGDELRALASGQIVNIESRGGAGAVDWMTGDLVFGERPLSLILAEMEHHFEINVLVPDSLMAETLSGRLVLSRPRQSLDDLGTVLGGRFEESPKNVFRLILD